MNVLINKLALSDTHDRATEACHPLLYCPPQSRLHTSKFQDLDQRAVFLDRDGTLVEDIGYLTDPTQLKLLAGSIEGMRLLQDYFLIVMVTNQSAVARGLLDEAQLAQIHQSLAATLHGHGVFVDAVYACPHHPTCGAQRYRVQCNCRKPQPGMILQASDDWNIRLRSSFMVGDKGSDVLAGQRAGVAATVLIESYQTASSLTPEAIPAYTADNLYDAARLILTHQVE